MPSTLPRTRPRTTPRPTGSVNTAPSFSSDTGTPAAKMPPVPVPVRKARAARLRAAGQASAARFYQARLGQEEAVLFERDDRGHTAHFAPIRLLGGTAERVEDAALRIGVQKRLRLVLPVNVHEQATDLREDARRDRRAVAGVERSGSLGAHPVVEGVDPLVGTVDAEDLGAHTELEERDRLLEQYGDGVEGHDGSMADY